MIKLNKISLLIIQCINIVGKKDKKKEIRNFNFKFGLSGADLALPKTLGSDIFTPNGRDIKNIINQTIRKTKNKEIKLILTL